MNSTKIIIITALIIFSCSSDKNPSPVKTPAKCQISKITTSSLGGTSQSEYLYDVDGFITKILFSVSGASQFSGSKAVQYGTNRKVSKVETDSYSVVYSYNSSNQLTKLEYYSQGKLNSVTTFTYNFNQQLDKEISNALVSGNMQYLGYRVYSYPNGSTTSFSRVSFFDTKNVLAFTIDYEYDSKINPLSSLDLSETEFRPQPQNNITKSIYTQIAGGTSITTTINSFKYNEFDLPTEKVTDGTTVNYFYECK